jgi:MFS family permease
MVNSGRLFWVSVLALFTSAFGAALRAATANDLKVEWIDPIAPLQSGALAGSALGAAFLGFAVTLFVAGALVDLVGMRRMMIGCGLCFILGTGLITGAGILASGMACYRVVWAGMLVSGVGWGLTEATINPLIARLYPADTTHRLNLLHAWYPGGLIAGGLVGVLMAAWLPWQGILALILVPALAVIVAAALSTFPADVSISGVRGLRTMLVEIFRRPSFFIWFGAMFLTAASELAPGQWLDIALTNRVGMRGILLLVYVSALMFVFRHAVGRVARWLSNPGLLLLSSLLAAAGLLLLSRAQSPVAAIAASTVWGFGVCAMWPTMLASVAERYPQAGSWALGLMGSAGALSSFLVLPALGTMFDEAKVEIAGGPQAFSRLGGAALRQVEDAAASASFATLALIPTILLFVFGLLWWTERRRLSPRGTPETAL